MGAGYGRQMPQNLGSFLGGGYGSVFGNVDAYGDITSEENPLSDSLEITYKSTDTQKINGSERLDALAQWLEGRAVTYNGRTYQLANYPPLTDDRRLDSIERASSVYPTTPEQDGTINYRINMQLTYLKQQS